MYKACVLALTLSIGGCGSTESDNDSFDQNGSVDEMHRGVRLQLSHRAKSNSIQGTMTNTTDKEITDIQVEIRLKNGEKLGPVKQDRLFPGQEGPLGFSIKDKDIEGWTAHIEFGDGQ